jgi:hypothetical protein
VQPPTAGGRPLNYALGAMISALATPKKAGVATTLFAFSFFALCFNSQPHGWLAWLQLWTQGKTAEATITRLESTNHNTCHFSYLVGYRAYEGADQGCHFQVGQSLLITYLPSDPTFATSAEPRDEFLVMVLGPLLLSILGGIVMAARIRYKSR